MRSIYLVIAILMVASCRRDSGLAKVQEVPEGIVTTKPCPTLVSAINSFFPEAKDGTLNRADLFEPGATKKVLLTSESDVYITFVSEGASYKNTFGWYSYLQGSAPSGKGNVEMNFIFPNASSPPLKTGDRVRLGTAKFKAGTVIGFFLIEQGWEDGVVNKNKRTHYTDYNLNVNGHQQHVLFKEKDCGDIVLAFEDISLSDTGNPHFDKDYNDIIFTVSDNNQELNVSRIDTSAMVTLHKN